jgi:hypothetical protein
MRGKAVAVQLSALEKPLSALVCLCKSQAMLRWGSDHGQMMEVSGSTPFSRQPGCGLLGPAAPLLGWQQLMGSVWKPPCNTLKPKPGACTSTAEIQMSHLAARLPQST